jgi:hypothetical protein
MLHISPAYFEGYFIKLLFGLVEYQTIKGMPAQICPISEQAFSFNHGASIKARHHASIKSLF